MSLKSIRESYTNLLTAFEKSGIKLTEAQKGNLDTFIVGLESRIQNVKESTARATKKVVSENLGKEYKKVVESIMSNMAKNHVLAGKIEKKIQTINESKKFARKLDNYLDLYVESVLPKKTIIDYDRMQKLENVFESLKDTLLITDETVEAKKTALTESFESQKKDYETQIAKLQVKLNESMKKELAMHKKIEANKAKVLLESKLADLPPFEARQLRKRFAGASVAEIESKFEKILESTKKQLKEAQKKEALTLEDEVNQILNKKPEIKAMNEEEDDEEEENKVTTSVDEADEEDPDTDDLLSETEDDEEDEELNENEDDEEDEELNENEDDEEEEDEINECDDTDDDQVELNESEKVPTSLMSSWIEKYSTIETRGY